MFGKFFASTFTGSMMAAGAEVFAVWAYVIAHAVESRVELNARLLSAVIGAPVDAIEGAIEKLCAPDPHSRSTEHDGCRLIREGQYQYFVTGHQKYRHMRDEADRRDYNRLKKQESRARLSQTQGQPMSNRMSTLSANTEAEAEAEAKRKKHAPHVPDLPVEDRPEVERKRVPDCPHLEVLSLWEEVLPSLPQHMPSQWRGSRADHLRARWREAAVENGWQTKEEGITYMRKLFGYVGKSPFLTGRVRARDGKRPFVIELEWLVSPANWAKVHEGKYHQQEETA